MPEFDEIREVAFQMSGLDRNTWGALDDSFRLYWWKEADKRMRAALVSQDHSGLTLTTADETLAANAARKGKRFGLVRVEIVGEPVYTPDGQSLVHVRLPWFRETDGCWAVSVKDIVATDDCNQGSERQPSGHCLCRKSQ